EGGIKNGMKMMFMANGKIYEVSRLGVFTPKDLKVNELSAGEVGYVTGSIKTIQDAKVGDTITDSERPAEQPLQGYKDIKPMVFSGIYPVDGAQYESLRDALEKLQLNDSSLKFEPETSLALGFGFRCGFLGLLHMDIVKERLEREFDLSLITTAPTVVYKVINIKGEIIYVDNPSKLPPPNYIDRIEEPYIIATIITPDEFLGAIMQLTQEKRGVQKGIEYIGEKRVMVTYELPLNEVVLDFYDRLKSISKGYASMDYEYLDYRISNLIKLDILLNGDPVDALSSIIHKDKAYYHGKELAEKMKEIIPRQMFEVAIQAAIGGKIIARETVKPLRKNVIAKCYGGDITRKRKLLERQKEGKKRMKQIGKVEIPQETFMAVLKTK
ncbi:MAG TPA: translation elongation factor 4, partial [Nitrospinota bacterium]|nr:translation elongation factor 4 [Nitrospinota bacterium]